jgi:aspartate racemase
VRTIGLIGGMSWESTAEYYRLLNTLTRERVGGLHSARCVLYSVDFADVERMQVEARWGDAAELLAHAAGCVQAAGADFVLLCTNTMHKVADAIAAAIDIPLLHIGDATAEAVLAADVRTVGLLGTAFTMEQNFYRDRLQAAGQTSSSPTRHSARWSIASSTTNCVAGSCGTNPAEHTRRSSQVSLTPALKASSSAAPKSNCSSARRTARYRYSPLHAFTLRPRFAPRSQSKVPTPDAVNNTIRPASLAPAS